jgi:hypothetical protein
VSAREIEGRGKETGKERPAQRWPFHWVLVRLPFSKTNANAIVWKARCTTETETAIVTAEDLAHIRLRSLPLHPRFRRFANPVRVRR